MTEIITRKAAIMADLPRYYTGKPCGRGHMSERFTANGVCIQCSEENNAKREGSKPKKGMMTDMEVQALLLRGGPMSRAQAEAAGLKWYNHPLDFRGACHGIIGLNGLCPLCGGETPEPVTISKEVLDLLS